MPKGFPTKDGMFELEREISIPVSASADGSTVVVSARQHRFLSHAALLCRLRAVFSAGRSLTTALRCDHSVRRGPRAVLRGGGRAARRICRVRAALSTFSARSRSTTFLLTAPLLGCQVWGGPAGGAGAVGSAGGLGQSGGGQAAGGNREPELEGPYLGRTRIE